MVLHGHPKRFSFNLKVSPDASHAEYAEDLSLGIVAQGWARDAAPISGAQGDHASVEVAQGAENQEHICVGGGIIDGRRGVGDADGVLGAGVHVDLVVSGPWVWLACNSLRP